MSDDTDRLSSSQRAALRSRANGLKATIQVGKEGVTDAVARTLYPGFDDHPGHEVATRQMRDFGGMVSLVLDDDALDTAVRFMQNLTVFSLAESLGGVESLVSHPASMTHGSIPADVRRAAGLPDSLVRLSVGVEDEADLIADLDQALAAL